MHPALEHTTHRRRPLPTGPWTWRQRWEHLLFAHWAVPAARLRPHLPHRVRVQEFEGSAWLAVVPFVLSKLAVRFLPPVPGLNTFPELNLRTYVEVDGVPGVWFFSLDASNPVAVWAANTIFGLPYHRARMQVELDEGGEGDGVRVAFVSRRRRGGVGCDVAYRPTGPAEVAEPGSLPHWLTERYCVYAAAGAGRLTRTEVHHAPWPLQPAEAEIRSLDLGRPLGIELTRAPDLLHYSRGVPVVLWPGRRV
jgi:hypothetical protein